MSDDMKALGLAIVAVAMSMLIGVGTAAGIVQVMKWDRTCRCSCERTSAASVERVPYYPPKLVPGTHGLYVDFMN